MCWNQYVSLNTFIFSTFVLLLIVYNNRYSPYKIKELDNIYYLIFLMSFITMQLIEFFLWRNLNNKEYNKLFSILGSLLILLQPVASLMMLKNYSLRINMLIAYCIPFFSYFIYKISSKNFTTVVAKNGHLKWDWADFDGSKNILLIFWLFFLFFSLFINKFYFGLIYTIVLLILSFYSYNSYGTFGSLWCWAINSIILYYAIKLLVLMPFNEHGFC